MRYIESPDYYSRTYEMAVFLAGGITDYPNGYYKK